MTAQLTAGDIATRLGLSLSAVRAHRQRGTMPAPDGTLGNSPWWWETTIAAWAASRRPRGQQSSTWTPERRAAHSERMKASRREVAS
jgi:hypothetical protein